MAVLMTYELAMAAAADAANRRMRSEGRKRWNRADWNHMVETFNRLFPVGEAVAQGHIR